MKNFVEANPLQKWQKIDEKEQIRLYQNIVSTNNSISRTQIVFLKRLIRLRCSCAIKYGRNVPNKSKMHKNIHII